MPWLTLSPRRDRLAELYNSGTLRKPCLSWYGHTYRETSDGTAIYCPTCGDNRPLNRSPRRTPTA